MPDSASGYAAKHLTTIKVTQIEKMVSNFKIFILASFGLLSFTVEGYSLIAESSY